LVRRPDFEEHRSALELAAASAARAAGDTSRAVDYLTSALGRNTRHAWTTALFRLDDLHRDLARPAQMRPVLQAALHRRLTSAPTVRSIQERLARAAMADGDSEVALTALSAAYESLTRLDAADPDALTLYGSLLQARNQPGDPARADWAFTRARIETEGLTSPAPGLGD
jgi:hypothetical protein